MEPTRALELFTAMLARFQKGGRAPMTRKALAGMLDALSARPEASRETSYRVGHVVGRLAAFGDATLEALFGDNAPEEWDEETLDEIAKAADILDLG